MRATVGLRLTLTALLLVLIGLPAAGAAGSLVTVEHDQTYSTAAVNEMAARLFNGRRTPEARFTVDVFIIRYESTDLQEQPTLVTAQLFVPRYDSHAERPVYIFAPGTTGLTDQCRPLREHQIGINWGLYRNHVLAHAGQGAIGMIPEYMHFGDPDRLQPYFIAEAEARVLLDAIRAVRNYFREQPRSSDYPSAVRPAGAFLAGFSQGGHAAFAAADRNGRYAPDVRIAGIIGYGPTTSVESLFREFSVVAPSVIYVYARYYGSDRFDPGKMLADRWLENLAHDVRRLCILGLQSYYPWRPGPLFRPEFNDALLNRRLAENYPEIAHILRKNSTGLGGHRVPALILQGSNDVVVNLDDQSEFVVALRGGGSPVRYLIYPDTPHDTRQIGFDEVIRWMEAQTVTQENR